MSTLGKLLYFLQLNEQPLKYEFQNHIMYIIWGQARITLVTYVDYIIESRKISEGSISPIRKTRMTYQGT